MIRTKQIIILLYLAVFCSSAIANTQKMVFEDEVKTADDALVRNKPALDRFQQHESNHLLLDYFRDHKVDRHIDAQLSVRYLLTEPQGDDYKFKRVDWNIAFSVTAEFDFYFGTRDSGPVMGRRYNPGLQFYYSRNKPDGWQEYRLSIEHESNGQSAHDGETLNELSANLLNTYIDEPDFDEAKAMDLASETISISNNFISVGGVYRFNNAEARDCDDKISCFDIHVKLRHQALGDIENGEFAPTIDIEDELKDFQGSKISLITQWESTANNTSQYSLELNYRTGQIFGGNFATNNTLEASFYYNWHVAELVVPLFVNYRKGYLEELYNYSQRSSRFLIGFHFLY